MPYLTVDKDGTEKIFDRMPRRDAEKWWPEKDNPFTDMVTLPKGSISRLLAVPGAFLSWEDGAYHLEELPQPSPPQNYEFLTWVCVNTTEKRWEAVAKSGVIYHIWYADRLRQWCWKFIPLTPDGSSNLQCTNVEMGLGDVKRLVEEHLNKSNV